MLAVVAACLLRLVTASPSVETPFGRIDGQAKVPGQGEAACEEFIGIPFAEPPARFQPPEPWNKSFRDGKFSATAFGSPCLQVETTTGNLRLLGSEDCLYLNVWRPANLSGHTRLAVMLWIHGGAFREGASESPESPFTVFYDGCRMAARQDVIVVSLNYRLSIFGFGTFARSADGYDANWGFKDQREGMRWVQNHIAAFGGDRELLTIFGESAGAMSIFHHLASPLSAGLFRAAIMQSGFPQAVSSAYGVHRTAKVASAVGCSGASLRECLLSSNSSALALAAAENCMDVFAQEEWGAVVDGEELDDYPDRIIRRGDSAAVPTLSGYDSNEANLFVYMEFTTAINTTQEKEYLKRVFVVDRDPRATLTEKELEEVMDVYNSKYADPDARVPLSALLGDYTFICGTLTNGVLQSTRAPAYVYRFDQRPDCPQARHSIPGVYHSIELPYVFGNPPPTQWPIACEFSPLEQALSNAMQERWASFAKTLLPEGRQASSSLAWPAFTNQTRQMMLFKEPHLLVEELPASKLNTCSWLYSFQNPEIDGTQRATVIAV